MRVKNIFIYVIILTLLMFTSCKQGKIGQKGTVDTTLISKDTLTKELKEIVYPLPSPFEVYQKLEDIGATYSPLILNPVRNIDKYYTERTKALNLGIYSADLSYVTVYNKTQEIQLYSKNVKKLIDDFHLNINFQDLYNEEMRKKLENKDTLIQYITNTFYDVYKNLATSGDPSLSILMITGVWVEGLYIASHISESTFNNTEIVKIIYDQNKSLRILLDLLSKYLTNEYNKSLYNALNKIKQLYDKGQDGLTEKLFNEIKSSIATLRTSIVD